MQHVHRVSPNPLHDLIEEIAPRFVESASGFVYANGDRIDLSHLRQWYISVQPKGANALERLNNIRVLLTRAVMADAVPMLKPVLRPDGSLHYVTVEVEFGFVERFPGATPFGIVAVSLGTYRPDELAEAITTDSDAATACITWDLLRNHWAHNDTDFSFTDTVGPLIKLENNES